MGESITLPAELGPALWRRVEALLADVPLVAAVPELDATYHWPATLNRCVVCYQSGVLGGHHGKCGRIEWIYRSCHRRLHRRHRSKSPGHGRRRR